MGSRRMTFKYSLKSAERHLESLAYASIFLDGFVALATLLSLGRPSSLYYTSFLYVSDYLVFAEVVIAISLSALIIYFKYAKRLSNRIALSYFRYRVSTRKRQVRQIW